MGWIMGPIATIPPLALGAATVLIEGVPDHPTPDRLWRTVERHAITHLGLSPTVIRALAAHGDAWVDRHDLRPLRVLGSTGEPLNPSAWRWLHARVARGVLPIINLTGGTEVGGPLLSCSPMVPSREGRMAGPPPGIAVDVFSAAGTPVIGEVGDLVVTKSWPAMTKGFWREPERYLETYWSRWPGIWVHGDRAIRYEDGSWELVGRSDDVIKVAGKRVGPTEFEAVAAGVPGVAAAAAVGVPHDMKGEVAVVVIVPGAGIADPVALATQVGDRIASSMGKALRPAAVLPVEALPLTRSAKVHRRAVRAWLTGTDPGDLSTLDNPEAEAAITAARPRLREALER
jgi:acetyl-CoA synthetase